MVDSKCHTPFSRFYELSVGKCDLMLIACDGPLHKEFPPGCVVDKWQVSGKGVSTPQQPQEKKFLARLLTSARIYYWVNYELLNPLYGDY